MKLSLEQSGSRPLIPTDKENKMKKLNKNKIIKVNQNDLSDFEIGQIETCNFIINNLKREIQRLKNFEVKDFLEKANDLTYNAKYLTTLQTYNHCLYQIELYKQDILSKGAN